MKNVSHKEYIPFFRLIQNYKLSTQQICLCYNLSSNLSGVYFDKNDRTNFIPVNIHISYNRIPTAISTQSQYTACLFLTKVSVMLVIYRFVDLHLQGILFYFLFLCLFGPRMLLILANSQSASQIFAVMPEIIKQKIELAFGYYNSNHVDTKYSRRIDFFLFAFSRQIVVYSDDGN